MVELEPEYHIYGSLTFSYCTLINLFATYNSTTSCLMFLSCNNIDMFDLIELLNTVLADRDQQIWEFLGR